MFLLVWIPIYFMIKKYVSTSDDVLDLGGLTISEMEEVKDFVEQIKARSGQVKKESKVQLRTATDDDKEDMAEICRSNIELYDKIMPGAFEKQAEKFENQGLSISYKTEMVEFNGENVGFTGIKNLTDQHCYLAALYLHKNFHHNGIGSSVMDIIKAKATQDGFEEILLLVHKEAIWAKQFYIKYGFITIDTEEEGIKSYGNEILKDYCLPNTELMRLIISN